MRKIVSFMHMSLDGFVGKPNWEDFSWPKINEEIFELSSRFTAEADIALYGRVTFQGMEAYWPTAGDQPNASKHDLEHAAWYNSVQKIVLSRSLEGQTFNNTRIIAQNAAEEIAKLKQQPGRDILILGSPGVVHTLMAADLIDEYRLTINPVLHGGGIPMFKNPKAFTELGLLESRTYDTGVIFVRYAKV